MTEDGHARRPMEIPADVAEAAGVPDDLQSDVDDLAYFVPNTIRRRRVAVVYAVLAALTGLVVAAASLPALMWLVPALLLALAVYHRAAGWDLSVREHDALDIANRHVDFAVGHASATVNFEGWLAKPVWNVLVFSADEPPTRRALVRIDGRIGTVMEAYVEDVPQAMEASSS